MTVSCAPVLFSQKSSHADESSRIHRPIYLSWVLKDRSWFYANIDFSDKGEKNLMGSLSDASTYRAQSVAGWRSFSILFSFFSLSCIPYRHSPCLQLSRSLPPSVFPRTLSHFSWQLVGHIWPVISKMSSKIMRWAHTRLSLDLSRVKVT